MKVVWINGWGLGTGYLERLASNLYPEREHEFIQPKEDWSIELDNRSKDSTIVAYSLGAFLLLNRPDLCRKFERAVFMAPFEDLKKESGLGGRVHLAQLVYLRRWLQRDNIAAIKDFIARAGLSNHSNDLSGLHDADLIWGIDRLINDSVKPGILDSFEVWIGGKDRLLDAERISERYPSVNVLSAAGHDLGELLREANIEL